MYIISNYFILKREKNFDPPSLLFHSMLDSILVQLMVIYFNLAWLCHLKTYWDSKPLLSHRKTSKLSLRFFWGLNKKIPIEWKE